MGILRGAREDIDLVYESLFDPATRLVRAALLRDRVEVALARAGRRHRLVGVLHVRVEIPPDLTAGRPFDVLPLIAGRLRSAVRPDDTVARVGEHEFVVVCGDIVASDDVLSIMDRLESVIGMRIFLDEERSVLSAEVRAKIGRPRDRAVDLLDESSLPPCEGG